MDDTNNPDGPQGMRINRFLSQAGKGSRRQVEELVRQRRVQIDGETVTDLAARVHEGQTVHLDGKPIRPARTTVVFALNKPSRVLVSDADPQGRPLAIDIVRPLYSGRLFSVGRLDFLSSGLLLFTNDGELAQRLMRPASGLEREYVVEANQPISDDALDQFRRGVRVEGVHYRMVRYRRHSARRVSVVLAEGKNREIRRVFAHFGLRIGRIYRNRYGPVALGHLPEGQARPLTREEMRRLSSAALRGSRYRDRANTHRAEDRAKNRKRSTGRRW